MDELDRSLALYKAGLRSECLGHPLDWDPQPPAEFQRRHNEFWSMVSGMIQAEPGDYEDLPDWMTEVASDQLENDN